MNDKEPEQQGLTLWQVFGSVVAAAIGVQKKENQERDFKYGKPGQFVVVGLVFTLTFVLIIYGVVQLVLHFATA